MEEKRGRGRPKQPFRWNERKRRFVYYYVYDCDSAADAARKAGYSKDRAAKQAYRLLGQDEIRKEVNRLNRDRLVAECITPQRVATEWSDMAGLAHDFTPFDLFVKNPDKTVRLTTTDKETGEEVVEEVKVAGDLLLKSLEDIPKELKKMVKAIKVVNTKDGFQNVSVEFYDKAKIMSDLSAALKLFEAATFDDAEGGADRIKELLEEWDNKDGLSNVPEIEQAAKTTRH